MIVTLTVTLIRGRYCEHPWTANFELEQSTSLADLHLAIQNAVGFDNAHLCCFFLSRTDRSREREYFDDDNELIYTKTISDIFPTPAKRKLFYLFDWGDNWFFKISLSRKKPHEPVPRAEYPIVVSKTGIQPKQYQTGY